VSADAGNEPSAVRALAGLGVIVCMTYPSDDPAEAGGWFEEAAG
jgi:hypothetical protein